MPFGARPIAKGTNSNFSLFTLNSSLPCKSVPNSLQIPFRNGRLKGEKGRMIKLSGLSHVSIIKSGMLFLNDS